MPFDLALSPNGDLIIAGNRDLLGVSGTALIEQRIRVRLRMMRGQWQYDPSGNLGSQLFTLAGKSPEIVQSHAPAYVREALRDMEEIQIDDVSVLLNTDRSAEIHVKYRLTEDDGSTIPDLLLDLDIVIPLGE